MSQRRMESALGCPCAAASFVVSVNRPLGADDMMSYWPFQQYEAELAKKNAARRRARSGAAQITTAQSHLPGYLRRPAHTVRHLLAARKPRPECGHA
jgi:hypothetical protein